MGIELKRIVLATHDLGWPHIVIIFSLAVILWCWQLKVVKKNQEKRRLKRRLKEVLNAESYRGDKS